jgi:hypothetical protein
MCFFLKEVGFSAVYASGPAKESHCGGFALTWGKGGLSPAIQSLPDVGLLMVAGLLPQAHPIDTLYTLSGSDAELGLDPESLFHWLPKYYIGLSAIQNK